MHLPKIKGSWVTHFFLFIAVNAHSQYVSLDKNEIQKLSKLIATDPDAKKIYQSLETTANAALKQIPDPIDTLISEGHLVTDPKKIGTMRSLADMNKIYSLAFVYKISSKKQYLSKCIEYMLAWANSNKGTGNPINDTKLDPVMESYDLVKDELDASDKKIVTTWLQQVADAEIANPRFKSGNRSANNNWNSHRIKVIGNVAYILNNQALQKITDTLIQKQIEKNLYADGSGMDFEERDALHYHTYTLEPLLKIAEVIKRATGSDYFTYTSATGSSIQKSVAFLFPFVTGEKRHQEFVNSKILFDQQRAANKEPGYAIGADFKPEIAVEVLSYAAYFDKDAFPIVQKLLNSSATYPNWQTLLNAARH